MDDFDGLIKWLEEISGGIRGAETSKEIVVKSKYVEKNKLNMVPLKNELSNDGDEARKKSNFRANLLKQPMTKEKDESEEKVLGEVADEYVGKYIDDILGG